MVSKSKSNRKAAAAVAATAAGVSERITNAEQVPVAVVAAVQPKPVVEKRGKSTLTSPVAQVWAFCHNARREAREAGKPEPTRSELVNGAIALGIAYYTARTQVQAYLKAPKTEAGIPVKLPRGLTLG